MAISKPDTSDNQIKNLDYLHLMCIFTPILKCFKFLQSTTSVQLQHSLNKVNFVLVIKGKV